MVTSLVTFDREEQREHLLPVVMRDSGSPPQRGTSTLTIVIGDRNDHEHFPAHKQVRVFNYRGSANLLLRSCD